MKATHKLFKTVRGIPHFAEVSVQIGSGTGMVLVSSDAFAWLRQEYGADAVIDGFKAFRSKAHRGARFALSASMDDAEPLDVDIVQIRFSDTDTTPNDVAVAACPAVWDAIGAPYPSHPDVGEEWS